MCCDVWRRVGVGLGDDEAVYGFVWSVHAQVGVEASGELIAHVTDLHNTC